MRDRYKLCRTHVADGKSSVGYVRCGLPRNWGEIRDKHCLAEPPTPASTRALNPLHRKQKKFIRRYISRYSVRRWKQGKDNIELIHYAGFGMHLWKIFSDVEQKGEIELAHRVGLGKMIFHLKKRGIRRVLVDRAERLSSDPAERLVLLQHFRSIGVRVIEISHPRELTSDLYLNRLAARSTPEGENAAREALRRLKWRGSLLGAKTRVGRKAFGASSEERTVLVRIFELCRKLPKDRRTKGRIRRSFKQIADTLNEEQLPSRTGKLWNSSTVQGIIKRERPDLVRNWSGRSKKR